MTPKKAKKTLGALLVAAMVFTSPAITWGNEKTRVITIQNKCGLEVKVPQKTMDLGNLIPGDSKQSEIQVSNKGSKDITLFIRTNILDETTSRGGYIADIMDFTINIKKDIIAEASFRDVVDQGDILVGTLKPGTSEVIELTTSLPGKETGNEYQGAYMKMSWTFVTQCAYLQDNEETVDPEKGGSTGGNTGGNTSVIEITSEIPSEMPEEIAIENEPLPLGIVEPNIEPTKTNQTTIVVEDDIIPYDFLKMPKTGQLASFYYYGIGSVMMMLGVYLKKK